MKVKSEFGPEGAMQPGLRLVLESSVWEPESVEPLLESWGGKYLESDHSDGMWRYSVTSKIPGDDPIVQQVMIQFQRSEIEAGDSLTTMLFEVGLMHEDEEDPELVVPGLPPYFRLLPQRVIHDIVSMGDWTRMGVPVCGSSRRVEFDDVEDWWADICLEADRVTQVIVGSALSGDLPVVEPDTVSTILAGLANVHHASSLATMEKMNEVMGRLGSPRGSVRILLSDPSTNQKQPLYTNERLMGSRYVLEDGTMKRRHFEHDIFLRLAKRTLVGRVVPEYWEGVIQIPSNPEEEALKRMEKARLERIRNIEDLKTKTEELEKQLQLIEDAYHNATLENEGLRKDLSEMEDEKSDLEAEIAKVNGELEHEKEESEGWRDSFSKMKERNKSLKKKHKESTEHLRKIEPVLKKFVEVEGASNIEDLLGSLEERLFDSEGEEDPIEESVGFESMVSVLQHYRTEKGQIFDIRKSAFNSAEKSTFKFPRRVEEALEMMERSHDYIRNRSRSGQSVNYVDSFRKFSDSVFQVSNKETKATMEAYGDQRVFDGMEMQAHIKIGNRDAADRTIRIHFTFDKGSEKFVIGHCGRHLPTSGMKR